MSLYLMISVTTSLPLCLNFDLFEVLGYLPSLPRVLFECFFNSCCVVTQDNGRTTTFNAKKSLFVCLKSARRVHLSSKCARPRESFTQKCTRDFRMSQYKCCFVSMSICVSWNKLTSEMGDFFTDVMRDSNSHEFKVIVDSITFMPNEELEESLDQIDETLTQKESSVTTAFSWSNVSSQNRGGSAKPRRSKIDNSVVVIDSTQHPPSNRTSPLSLYVREYLRTYIS